MSDMEENTRTVSLGKQLNLEKSAFSFASRFWPCLNFSAPTWASVRREQSRARIVRACPGCPGRPGAARPCPAPPGGAVPE